MLSPPFPSLAQANYPGGVDLGTAIVLPPGGEIRAYVRSTGPADGDPLDLNAKLVTTLNAGLARCRANRGDTVVVLPGHAESIATADAMSSLVAGTTIMGIGSGTLRPTFTWTATGSTFLLDVANVKIINCILNMDPGSGSVTVGAPITVSAAGCKFINCMGRFSTDANSKVTIGITTTAAADELGIHGCHFYGATAGECTTFLDLIGTDRLHITDTVIEGATSNVAVGIVRFATTASLNIKLERNTYINRKALSTAAVTGLAGVSGVSRDEHFAYLDTSSLTAWLTSAGLMTFHRPTVTNTTAETGTENVGTVSA